jgi:predicted nucleotidyltransferase
MNGGLQEKHKQAFIETLTANKRVERVVLFGSRAMGTFATTSDVDLALFGEQLTRSDLADLGAAVEQLSVPQRVDLLLYKDIGNDNLLRHIAEHGLVGYHRDEK